MLVFVETSTELTVPTSNSMALQSGNRLPVHMTTTLSQPMGGESDIGTDLLAPEAITTPLPVCTQPTRSEVSQDTQSAMETGTERLSSPEVTRCDEQNLPAVTSGSSSSHLTFDTVSVVDALSKKHGISLMTPVLSIMKLNVKPRNRRVCTSATFECMPDS